MRGRFAFINRYKIIDLYRSNSGQKGGLLNLANSFNIPMKNKGLLDDYKTCMHKALIDCPKTFISYAIDDVRVLFTNYFEKMKQHNHLLKETFDLSDHFKISKREFPTTCGSLVNKSFIAVLKDYAGKNNCSVKFLLSIYKLGILNTSNKQYKENVRYYNEKFSDIPKLLNEFEKYEENLHDHSFFRNNVFLFNVLNSASISYFLTANLKTTIPLNALVTGRRANN